MIRITAKQDGFRRCGVAFSRTATDFPNKAFTAEQLETLQAEPNLVVEILEDKKKEEKKEEKKDEKK